MERGRWLAGLAELDGTGMKFPKGKKAPSWGHDWAS